MPHRLPGRSPDVRPDRWPDNPTVILVCGEALMDVVVRPDGARHAAPGGGPFNTARALGRLGVPAAFLGRLSEDEYGRCLAQTLREAGASLAYACRGPAPTTVALAHLNAAGSARYEFQIDGTSAPNLTSEMLPADLGPDVALHVGTLGLVLEPMATTLVALLRREQGRRLVMVDPNVRPQLIRDRPGYLSRLTRDVFPFSTIIKASVEDLAWLYPHLNAEAACLRLLEYGPRLVVVTLGKDGAFGLTRDAQVRAAVSPVKVVDTIGAGDIFGAALLAWLHDRQLLRTDLHLPAGALEAMLHSACAAAAWTCTRAGAVPPSREDLARHVPHE